FHAYRDKLFAFILKLSDSRQMSEDVVQEVFMKIWLKREVLSEIEYFNAYLFRVAHNHAINLLKRRSREIIIRAKKRKNSHYPQSQQHSQLIFNNIHAKLRKVVEGLPNRQIDIYRLNREQGLKHEEIAQQLKQFPSRVKTHIKQAMQII